MKLKRIMIGAFAAFCMLFSVCFAEGNLPEETGEPKAEAQQSEAEGQNAALMAETQLKVTYESKTESTRGGYQLFKFNNISSFPKNAVVSSARLYVDLPGKMASYTTKVSVYPVIGHWDGATSGISGLKFAPPILKDKVVVGTTSSYDVSVTDYFKAWVSGSLPNGGFMAFADHQPYSVLPKKLTVTYYVPEEDAYIKSITGLENNGVYSGGSVNVRLEIDSAANAANASMKIDDGNESRTTEITAENGKYYASFTKSLSGLSHGEHTATFTVQMDNRESHSRSILFYIDKGENLLTNLSTRPFQDACFVDLGVEAETILKFGYRFSFNGADYLSSCRYYLAMTPNAQQTLAVKVKNRSGGVHNVSVTANSLCQEPKARILFDASGNPYVKIYDGNPAQTQYCVKITNQDQVGYMGQNGIVWGETEQWITLADKEVHPAFTQSGTYFITVKAKNFDQTTTVESFPVVVQKG